MARINNGINGAFSGRVGTVVGYTRYGQTYMRSTPKKFTKPPSEKQILNRKAMAAVQEWLTYIKLCVRVGFQNYSSTQHGFGNAVSYLKLNALNEDLTIDPARAMISWGDLDLPSAPSVSNPEEGILEFTWEPGGRRRDRAMVLAYASGMDREWDLCGAQRAEGRHILRYGNMTGKEVNLYIGFVSEERDRCSNSVYLGKITLL